MKRTLWLSTLRWPLRRPWQALLAIIGVAMGVAVVIAIDLANDSARRAFLLSTATVTGQATDQLVGGPTGIPEQVFTDLRVTSGVRQSAPIVEGYATTVVTPTRTLQILGIDPFSEGPFRPEVLPAGAGFDGALIGLLSDPNAVIVSRTTAEALQLSVGADLPVLIGGASHTLRVVGILDPASTGVSQALGDVLITDISIAQGWLGKVGRLDRIDLIISDDAQRSRIATTLPAGVRMVTPQQRAQSTTEMTQSFEINLTALSLLALVVGMFLIYNTMTFSVVQRRGLLGTLRCIGVSQREIATLMLVEGVVIGVVGTAAGIGIGIGLAQLLLGLVARTINDIYFVVTVTSVQVTVAPILKGAGDLGAGP